LRGEHAALREGHSLGRKPSLEKYCAARHLLVSRMGGPHGFVDDVLKQQRTERSPGTSPAMRGPRSRPGQLTGLHWRHHGHRPNLALTPTSCAWVRRDLPVGRAGIRMRRDTVLK
jgi:hypothetical protein